MIPTVFVTLAFTIGYYLLIELLTLQRLYVALNGADGALKKITDSLSKISLIITIFCWKYLYHTE